MCRARPRPSLFPYTTLFRSLALLAGELERAAARGDQIPGGEGLLEEVRAALRQSGRPATRAGDPTRLFFAALEPFLVNGDPADRKSTRLNSSHLGISYAVFC